MMVRPWARATAAMPLRPAPLPTTAAAPAPMNTNAKVPMNSASSLAAIRLDIVVSRDEFGHSLRDRLGRKAGQAIKEAGLTRVAFRPASLMRSRRRSGPLPIGMDCLATADSWIPGQFATRTDQ